MTLIVSKPASGNWLSWILFTVIVQSLILVNQVNGLPSLLSGLENTDKLTELKGVSDKVGSETEAFKPMPAAINSESVATVQNVKFDSFSPTNPPGKGFNPSDYISY